MTLDGRFELFRLLSKETRRMVWERVTPPTRLVGQVNCIRCNIIFMRSGIGADAGDACTLRCCHPRDMLDQAFPFIVHPRSSAIFPPLHACRESRDFWLPHFWQPPQVMLDPVHSTQIRFTVPFISYEYDIFTNFGRLDDQEYDDSDPGQAAQQTGLYSQAFAGVDVWRIRHVGICENGDSIDRLMAAVPFHLLVQLESFTVIAAGPHPVYLEQMLPQSLQGASQDGNKRFPCQLRDIAVWPPGERHCSSHLFFNTWRPVYPCFPDGCPQCKMPPLDSFVRIVRAYLWHLIVLGGRQHVPRRLTLEGDGAWLGQYLRDAEFVPEWSTLPEPRCPFRVAGCAQPASDGRFSHTLWDIWEWEPWFEIKCKYVCDESWLPTFDGWGVFEPSTCHRNVDLYDQVKMEICREGSDEDGHLS